MTWPCPSSSSLDLLLGLRYRATCGPPVAALLEPRSRSFIVVEDSEPPPLLERGGVCVYILVKRGLSTPEAVKRLARLLGARAAEPLGLKDTDATTAQLVCVHGCPRGAPRIVRGAGLWTRLLGRSARGCRSARLRGNRFTILLRPLPGHEAGEVAERLREAASRPLPAYYAYQRFGTRRPSTGHAAAAVLHDPVAAVLRETLDYPYPDEAPEAIQCRLVLWRSGGCPGGFYEKRLAEQAEALDTRLRGFLASIYASALQAAIFNWYLSLRIEKGYPLEEPVPGERRLPDGRPAAPVPPLGPGRLPGGEAGSLLREAAAMLSLSPEDLRHPEPLPRRAGYLRPVYTRPRGLRIHVAGEVVAASFWMEKGMYATLLLREAVDPAML